MAGVKSNTAAMAKLKGEQRATLVNVAEMEGWLEEVAEDAKENVEEQEDLKHEMKGIAEQLNGLRAELQARKEDAEEEEEEEPLVESLAIESQ